MSKKYIIVLVYFIVSIFLKIYFTNLVASSNYELISLYNTKSQIEREISKLNYIENNISSIKKITQRAIELGFIKSDLELANIDISNHFSIAYKFD